MHLFVQQLGYAVAALPAQIVPISLNRVFLQIADIVFFHSQKVMLRL
jgi:hypothetical protein